MLKLLFWVALIAIAVYYFRRMNRPAAAPSASGRAAPTELVMVRCAHCGVHLPKEHALLRGKDAYCTQAHLEQGPVTRER